MAASLAPLFAFAGKAAAAVGLTGAGSGMALASTAATLGSTMVGMQAAKASGKAAQMNADMMQRAADRELKAGERDVDKQRLAGAKHLSEKTLAMAANGVDVESASSLDLLDDDKTQIESDAFEISEASREDASGSQRAAANYQAEANMSGLNQATTLLSGASTVANRWSAWQQYNEGTA